MPNYDKKSISPNRFVLDQRIKRSVQKYFDPLGTNATEKDMFKDVYIHDIERNNFPEDAIYTGGARPTWFKTTHIQINYDHIVFGLGGSFVYMNETGEWKSRILFGFEKQQAGWKEIGVFMKGHLLYKDIVEFDKRITNLNWGLPHIYAYFKYSGSPFYNIRYDIADKDVPEDFYLNPAKQIKPAD